MSWMLFFAALVIVVAGGACVSIRRLVGVFLSLVVVLSALYHGIDGISGDGLNEAVIYHMLTGLDGVGLAGQGGYLALWLAVLALGLALVWFALGRAPRRGRVAPLQLVAVALSAAAVFTAPLAAQLYQQAAVIRMVLAEPLPPEPGYSLGELDSHYVTPDSETLAGLDKNIVWIYLEGLETTYFDHSRFGELLPRLTELSQQATRFEQVRHGYLTWWTMGGLVGSQCGVPLIPFGDSNNNELTGFDQFLPGATCVADLLKSAGYRTGFIGGAALEFAGKGDFLASHSYQQLWGRKQLRKALGRDVPVNVWGYYDDATLGFARQQFREMYAETTPFLLSILTVDTHPPAGFPSPRCAREGLLKGDDGVLDAVRCTDFLVAEFIEFVRRHDVDNNTLVVVSTDHYSQKNTVHDRLVSADRRLLFWTFPPDQEQGREVTTRGSTYDMGPTVLAMAGAPVRGLGFGRNLLQSQRPQAVTQGQLQASLPLLSNYLWQPTVLAGDLVFERDEGRLRLGARGYEYPLVFKFDSEFKVSSVAWPSPWEPPLVKRVDSSPALVVEDCGWWSAAEQGNLCLFFRSRAGRFSAEKLEGNRVAAEHIRQVLADEVMATPWPLKRRQFVVSSGGAGRFSGIVSGDQVVPFRRGINIYQLSGGSVSRLVTFDTCKRALSGDDFESLEAALANARGQVVVAVDDSGVCGDTDLAKLAAYLESPLLGKLQVREPYIGVFARDRRLLWEKSAGHLQQVFLNRPLDDNA